MLDILKLISTAKCYEEVRTMRWSSGVTCPKCNTTNIKRYGSHKGEKERRCYLCKSCGCRFDDLTGTIYEGSHLPLKTWVLCSYLMALNLSNSQISKELEITEKTAQSITTILRESVVKKKERAVLEEEVELDEVYVVAGQKGQPKKVKERKRSSRRNRLKGKRGRGTMKDEKNPILGMIQRSGKLVLKMLPDVKIETIKPIISKVIKVGSTTYTDEYVIYHKMNEWGYKHKTVNHGSGEYARDEDKDGFHEIHVNTQEGCWSLLRSWLRPHRGISQSKLPFYLGFFEFIHNAKKRGASIMHELMLCLLSLDKRTVEEFLDFEYI